MRAVRSSSTRWKSSRPGARRLHVIRRGGRAAHAQSRPEHEVWQRTSRLVDQTAKRLDGGLGDLGDRLLDRGQSPVASTRPPRCRRSRRPRGRRGRRGPAAAASISTPIAIRSLEQMTPVGRPAGAASSSRSADLPALDGEGRMRDQAVRLDPRGEERLRAALRLVPRGQGRADNRPQSRSGGARAGAGARSRASPRHARRPRQRSPRASRPSRSRRRTARPPHGAG